jgi:hypothetical protein
VDVREADFLVSAGGARLLEAARSTRGRPAHARPGMLAGLGSAEEVRAALRQDDLRVRAAEKTPHAEAMLFERVALEQATPWAVAVERATRWPGSADDVLHDLGAGIGADALAAALSGRRVVAWERDPVRSTLLRHNAAALGVESRVTVEARDALADPPRGDLALLDPDRRPGGARTRDPDRFEPPAGAWPALLAGFFAAMVKVGPAAALDDAGPFEVVSLDGAPRERRLFRGAFGALPPRRALALPSGRSVEGPGLPWPDPADAAPGLVLLDPDPAVTVAGLVGDLALRHDLRPVHPRIAYLVGERADPAAPGAWMTVDAVLPARAREIDAWLRARDVGRLTIRARGVADPVEAWRRRLHPRGSRAGTLALYRDGRERWTAVTALDDDAP